MSSAHSSITNSAKSPGQTSANSPAAFQTTPSQTVSTTLRLHGHGQIPDAACGGLMRLEYPTYMQPYQFQEYMEDYAKHFGLLRDIVFNADVKLARRSDGDAHWLIDVEKDGETQTVEYDRIVFCHGYQTKADIPTFEGQEQFEGVIMHSQAYREYV